MGVHVAKGNTRKAVQGAREAREDLDDHVVEGSLEEAGCGSLSLAGEAAVAARSWRMDLGDRVVGAPGGDGAAVRL